MKVFGSAKQVTIYCSVADTFNGKPLADAIVERALEFGLDGATVFHGIEGYGAHHEIHSPRIRRYKDVLPLVVVIVARNDRVDAFLPLLDEMIEEGLVTIQDVEVRQYRKQEDDGE